MGPCRLSLGCGKTGVGEHGLPVGLLRGHAAQRVVDDLAVRVAKVYVGQAVHLVVMEGLFQMKFGDGYYFFSCFVWLS